MALLKKIFLAVDFNPQKVVLLSALPQWPGSCLWVVRVEIFFWRMQSAPSLVTISLCLCFQPASKLVPVYWPVYAAEADSSPFLSETLSVSPGVDTFPFLGWKGKCTS